MGVRWVGMRRWRVRTYLWKVDSVRLRVGDPASWDVGRCIGFDMLGPVGSAARLRAHKWRKRVGVDAWWSRIMIFSIVAKRRSVAKGDLAVSKGFSSSSTEVLNFWRHVRWL